MEKKPFFQKVTPYSSSLFSSDGAASFLTFFGSVFAFVFFDAGGVLFLAKKFVLVFDSSFFDSASSFFVVLAKAFAIGLAGGA